MGVYANGIGDERRSRVLKKALVALALLGVMACAMAVMASPARASTITVNSTADGRPADDGKCTLREAITSANTDMASGATTGECAAGSGSDVIDIGVTGTVNLTRALPNLASNIEIEGPGADQFKVRRDTGGDYGIFFVKEDRVVSISGMTISNGLAYAGTLRGGGINNQGLLKISNSTINNNQAVGGGGISNQGTLEIVRSTVSNNRSALEGGGVWDAEGGGVKITRSTISNNSATNGEGGGVFTDYIRGFDQKLSVANSTFSGNSAKYGGGLNVGISGLATVKGSTFSGNNADRGGAIYTDSTTGDILVRNSILAGNDSKRHGAHNCDSPHGIGTYIGSRPTPEDFYGFENGGYNLVDDASCWGRDGYSNGEIGLDPAGLQDNGGPTETIALLPMSPAINRIPEGENGCGTTFDVDQRGVSRPQGNRCDIGAFEKRSAEGQ